MFLPLTDELSVLIEMGNELAAKSSNPDTVEAFSWVNQCRSVLISHYGINSDEVNSFRRSDYPAGKIKSLQVLFAIERFKQLEVFPEEIALQLLKKIDHSSLTPNQKHEVQGNILSGHNYK